MIRRYALCSLLLAGCTAAEEPKDTAEDTTDDTGTEDTEVPGADLDGTWMGACYEKTQVVIRYESLALTGTYTEYADDACTDAYHISEWKGNATVGDALANGAKKLDIAFSAFTSTALTEDNAALNNSYAYCGFTDWEAGVTKDVLGADCYGFAIPEGGVSLDIYAVEGNELRFGIGAKIGTSLTEADRPTELDDMRVFTLAE